MYTELINRHISDPEQRLKVFDKNSVYLPTKKIGKNNPKEGEVKAYNAARQGNGIGQRIWRYYRVSPKLKQQLADTKGMFKGKERKTHTEQIQQTEKEITEKLDKLPDVLKEDGNPDVQAFMTTYRKAEAVVEQYNRDLAAWERQVRGKRKPAKKEQAKPPERESVLKRQLQAEGKQRNQPRQRKKSFDRDSR